MEGGQVCGERGVSWLYRLTNCFIHMQTGLKHFWSLQQSDTVSPCLWWMTLNIASCREACIVSYAESRYQILLYSKNHCFIRRQVIAAFKTLHHRLKCHSSAERWKTWWWMEKRYWIASTFLKVNFRYWDAVVICSVLCHGSNLFLNPHCSRCWGEWLDRWSYTLYDNSPTLFFSAVSAVNFRRGVTVIDGLMTELCKSFNPFIKLNRGALDALYPSTSAHLASVKDTQCRRLLWEPWQELMTCSVESFYETWRFITEIHSHY